MEAVKKQEYFAFDAIEESEEDLCRALWIGVIIQAVIDATGKNCSSIDKANALHWLKGQEGIKSEFANVCDLAGIDFESARDRCAKIVRGEVPAVDFRAMKKAIPANRMNEDRRSYFSRAQRNSRRRIERQANGNLSQMLQSRLREANDNHANDNFLQPTKGE